MIFAKLRVGPSYAPNGHIYVQILDQIDDTPFGRFSVRDLNTNKVYIVYDQELELKWLGQPNKDSFNPS